MRLVIVLVLLSACGVTSAAVRPEASVEELWSAAAHGSGRPHFADALLLGPAMTTSVMDDPSLAEVGVMMLLDYDAGASGQMNYYSRVFIGHDVDALLSSAEFRRLAAFLAQGQRRIASAAELDLLQQISSPALIGLDLQVVEHAERRVLVARGSDGRVVYVEMLSMWGTSAQDPF